jgi:hypothetical protein
MNLKGPRDHEVRREGSFVPPPDLKPPEPALTRLGRLRRLWGRFWVADDEMSRRMDEDELRRQGRIK